MSNGRSTAGMPRPARRALPIALGLLALASAGCSPKFQGMLVAPQVPVTVRPRSEPGLRVGTAPQDERLAGRDADAVEGEGDKAAEKGLGRIAGRVSLFRSPSMSRSPGASSSLN